MDRQVIITGLMIICASTVAYQNKTYYYVTSNDSPMIECPGETCKNLTELLDDHNGTNNFSDAIIYLLPGIHQVSTERSKIISTRFASNLTITSFNLSARATIRCEGHVTFEFRFCVNLTITDITFEKCGALRPLDYRNYNFFIPKNVSVYISYSLGVYIINTSIINGTGIGLLLENVQYQVRILESIMSHNEHNLCLVNYDNDKNITAPSSVMVTNSSFSHAKRPHNFEGIVPQGITVYLYQTKFQTKLVFENVNVIENERNLRFKLTLCNEWSSIQIYNLKSVKTNNEKNLYFELIYSKRCNSETQTNIIIDSAEVVGGETHFHSKSRTTENNHNLHIRNFNLSKCLLFITQVKRVVFENIVIQNTESFKEMHIQSSIVAFRGLFLYQRNKRSQMNFKTSKIILGINSSFVFKHNSHLPESPLYCTETHISMKSGSSMLFNNNTGYECGGLTLKNSNIKFKGPDLHNMVFVHNAGKRGGAMAFYALSKLIPIEGRTNLTFMHNHATIVGGAIFVQDYDYTSREAISKFVQESKSGIKPPNFKFINNSAIQAGDALYGGAGNKKDFAFDISNRDRLSEGSTNPFRVCICINSTPHCKIKEKRFRPIPGQLFKIDVVAIGQWNGVVPANIQLKLNETSNATVKANEYIQSAGRNCTTLTYTFTFIKQYEIMNLQVITTNRNPQKEVNLKILLLFRNCSLGFSFKRETSTCICNKVLTDHGIECDIETLTVIRSSPKWISATYEHLLPSDQSGVIVHDHCPYDYCKELATQSLNLTYPDQQCALHRSGTLCGGCRTNFSQVLGTSKCKICTNSRLPLIPFLLALAGVALVLCLTFLNITVTVGTINGLIFYANIVKATDAFFFPQSASDSIFSIFIAWLNLDIGIETCFYDGLDAYTKTWLQFIFPLYIWFIVIIIIIAAHHSTKISKLVGKNPVQVLATLFLLSYAKMLRTIITIFSSTTLTYPDGYVKRVWLYDGNLDFLKGRHIPLFIVALMFLILISVPFTATLMCIQWLQKISHIKIIAWVTKLQPLFDAYTGPYKVKHRYWVGLLLLIRVCLFLVFSLNIYGDPTINLLAIVAFMFTLFAYLSIIGGVYKLWWINIIESAFILNLGLLSAAGLYKVAANVAITPAITYTSTGVAFILLIAIVSYHLAEKIAQTKCGQKVIAFVNKTYHCIRKSGAELGRSQMNSITDSDSSDDNIVTYTEVELREPLLASN
jgi:hypothetical protein